jgi:hypothetical protein
MTNRKTQNEISLLADQKLDSVVGGAMKLPHTTDHRQDAYSATGGLAHSRVSLLGGFLAGELFSARGMSTL